MEVRNAEEAEIDRLASIWYDGWRDAHEQIVPAELTRHRTRFYERCGWRIGTMVNHLETPAGEFPLEVWRYEKDLQTLA